MVEILRLVNIYCRLLYKKQYYEVVPNVWICAVERCSPLNHVAPELLCLLHFFDLDMSVSFCM